MSKSSDVSNVTRRGFLAGAGTVATTGYLLIGGPSSATVEPSFPPTAPNHVMTFDVTSNSIVCNIGSPQPPGSDPCTLTVKPKDVVHFKAITVPKSKRHLAVLFIDRTPFVDTGGDKVWAFHGSEGDEGNGIGRLASIDPALSEGDVFEFSVGVWDEASGNKPKSYTGDPTIIIGKGGSGIASAIAKLNAADGLLMKAAEAYPPKSDEIKSIEDRVTALIAQLKELLYNPPGQTK